MTLWEKTFHYRWEWSLSASPQALWPYIADTNQFNRDAGLPEVAPYPSPKPLAPGHQLVGFEHMGMAVVWDEAPFQWVTPHQFSVVRKFVEGPFKELRTLITLHPKADGGTQLEYQLWVTSANMMGWLAIPLQIGLLTPKTFEKTFRQYDQLAQKASNLSIKPAFLKLSPAQTHQLQLFRGKTLALGADETLLDHLTQHIQNADPLTLGKIRPYALAQAVGVPWQAMARTCLLATRGGLLRSHWDLVCPYCRGVKGSAQRLGAVDSQLHCDACNINVATNFEDYVEISFSPNPAICETRQGEYCIGSPQRTPHILFQQALQPNESREVTIALQPGTYRLRTTQNPKGLSVRVSDEPDQSPQTAIESCGNTLSISQNTVGTHAQFTLHNGCHQPERLMLEREMLDNQMISAAMISSFQEFRDLFAHEALRPDEQISIGRLTVVFTDLKDSTRLYRQVGDGPAFGSVLDHFAVLNRIVAEHDGAVVKTIGDAILAVFYQPSSAVKAMLQAQAAVDELAQKHPGLKLKVGIHSGTCLAVNLNNQLDYFGSTVNIAARLVGISQGQDVVLSDDVYHHPDVTSLFKQERYAGCLAEPLQTSLKGFDNESFQLYRILQPTPVKSAR